MKIEFRAYGLDGSRSCSRFEFQSQFQEVVSASPMSLHMIVG